MEIDGKIKKTLIELQTKDVEGEWKYNVPSVDNPSGTVDRPVLLLVPSQMLVILLLPLEHSVQLQKLQVNRENWFPL